MLYLIGLGLGLKDISVKGLEIAKKCEKVYLEAYTSFSDFSVEDLENLIGKKVISLNRKQVEEEKPFLKDKKDAVLLVYGDPLSATTHLELLNEVKDIEIIHAPSILTAVAETGLSLYKFGKTASIPFQQKNFKPDSFFDILESNVGTDAHTLFLLDLDPENNKFMTIAQALEILLEIAEKRKSKVFSEKTFCLGCSKLGSSAKKIEFKAVEELAKSDFGNGPNCLIVPTKLNFVEKDTLCKFK